MLFPLLGGFAIFLLSHALVWQHNNYASEELFEAMQSSLTTVQKMRLVSEMMEVVRARTRLTSSMLVEYDSFENDEKMLELGQLANRFVALRDQFTRYPLDPAERRILDKQQEIIAPIIVSLRHVVDVALWEEDESKRQEAMRLIYDKVLPGQGAVIDSFMQLQGLLEQRITESTIHTIAAHRKHLVQQLLVLILALLLVLFVNYIAIQRVVRIEKRLHFEKERAQITLISIADGVLTTDRYGVIRDANQVAAALVGAQPMDLLGKPFCEAFITKGLDGDGPALRAHLEEMLACANCAPISSLALLGQGAEQVILDATISPVRNDDNEVLGSVITLKDITEQHRLSERIQYQAHHDQLTGLFNRHAFSERCRAATERMAPNEVHCLCIIDLDRFKAINDTCGHKAGDAALKQIAEMIQGAIRRHDIAARIGGDEFTILLENCRQAEAMGVLEKLLEQIKSYRFMWGGQSFTLGFSIGVCEVYPEVHFERSFQAADEACFQAKDAGRMCIRTGSIEHDPADSAQEQESASWLERLHSALNEGRIELVMQPMLLTRASGDVGAQLYEVFMRLREGEALFPPMAFLPVAERHGLTAQLDRYVLNEVVQIIRQEPEAKEAFSINLASKTLEDGEAVEEILSFLRRNPEVAERLCFEVDETTLLNDLSRVSTLLGALNATGAMTALDNFSGSVGNCAHFEGVKLDFLKIDGALIQQAARRDTPRAVVDSVHRISRVLGMHTVAKHVETAEQETMAKEVGIDYLQGYHYGQPEPFDLSL
ncbi:putative diguanylate cyclase/phosphodiesterase [Magnetofaba australis IT-1]|uniref:Putative diguanylate cyclase/phosphodiesterase n=1 Tax=Magnetofaba australis IT-1 TaxID=1434232 RepID=A0A1Y2K230_9PROT|nr:putative diguanylate cyclase/phosphodiesterase [Magnetofaba australis IT-1]